MRNIAKMDIHRLLHSKVFYVAIAFLTIMAVALPMSGMSTNMSAMLGVGGATGGDDFMTSAMGAGVVFMLLGIILTLFICGDFAGGFAKNIFTSHANPKDYIGGKMISMGITSAFMLVLYTIESIISLAAFGYGVALPGGIIGLLAFILQKWLISLAFIALVMLVCLATRNTALGITAGFLIATGGLTMGISLFANAFGLTWLIPAFSFTISGSAALATLNFGLLPFVRILLASAAWLVVCFILSKRVVQVKDIV